MCTVLLRFTPGGDWPVLLGAVRDEFVARPWDPPDAHWPDAPHLIGGRDRIAGGTWLAVDPLAPAVSALLNGRRQPPPPEAVRRSRGDLPLHALRAMGAGAAPPDPTVYDTYHLLRVEPARAEMWTWDGAALTHRALPPGDHVIVNSGAGVNTLAGFAGTATPSPRPGLSTVDAWSGWVDLLGGGDFTGAEPRPLIVHRQFEDRVYGSTSATLVGLSEDRVRYDFTANPGPDAVWREVKW